MSYLWNHDDVFLQKYHSLHEGTLRSLLEEGYEPFTHWILNVDVEENGEDYQRYLWRKAAFYCAVRGYNSTLLRVLEDIPEFANVVEAYEGKKYPVSVLDLVCGVMTPEQYDELRGGGFNRYALFKVGDKIKMFNTVKALFEGGRGTAVEILRLGPEPSEFKIRLRFTCQKRIVRVKFQNSIMESGGTDPFTPEGIQVVEKLLAMGAEVTHNTNKPGSKRDQCALDMVNALSSISLARALIHHIDVHSIGSNHRTFVHDAILQDNLEIAELLVEHNADVNLRPPDCFTNENSSVLEYALMTKNRKMIEFVAQEMNRDDLDRNLKDLNAEFPLDPMLQLYLGVDISDWFRDEYSTEIVMHQSKITFLVDCLRELDMDFLSEALIGEITAFVYRSYL